MELDGQTLTDLSPAATTIAFQPILPPLRVPVEAGPADAPEKGSHLLAFADETSWERGWAEVDDHIFAKCEMTARMGCSLNATRRCAPAWWQRLLPGGDAAAGGCAGAREECEQREMGACLASAREKCGELARSSCEPVFSAALVAADPGAVHPRFAGAREGSRGGPGGPTGDRSSGSLAGDRGMGAAARGRQPSGRGDVSRQVAAALEGRAAGSAGAGAGHEGRPSNVIAASELGRHVPRVRSQSRHDQPAPARSSTSLFGAEGEGWEGGLIKPRLKTKDRPRFASLLLAKDERG